MSDVRVTLCFADFDQQNGFTGIAATGAVLTRALERGGGRLCPPLMFFVNIFRSIRSIAVIFSIPAQK